MSQNKVIVGPTGQLQFISDVTVLSFKTAVATYTSLPVTGNSKGDARLTNDTGHLYVWGIDAPSGAITNWADQGDIIDIDWSAITGKPTSSVADIDDAVSKRHAKSLQFNSDVVGEISVLPEALSITSDASLLIEENLPAFSEFRPLGNTDQSWIVGKMFNNGAIILESTATRLYLSIDSGLTFNETQPAGNIDVAWGVVGGSRDGSILFAGAYPTGRIYMSVNSGLSWSEIQPAGAFDYAYTGVACSSDGQYIVISTEGGRIYVSSNSGTSFNAVTVDGTGNHLYEDVCCSDDGSKMYVAEFGGNVYQSIDYGATWAKLTILGAVIDNYISLGCDADASVVAVGVYGGFVYVSTNGGSTWRLTRPNGTTAISVLGHIQVSTNGLVMILCTSTRLYFTLDYGFTWKELRPAGDVSSTWLGSGINDDGTVLMASNVGGRIYKITYTLNTKQKYAGYFLNQAIEKAHDLQTANTLNFDLYGNSYSVQSFINDELTHTLPFKVSPTFTDLFATVAAGNFIQPDGTIVAYAGETITLTDNATNYVEFEHTGVSAGTVFIRTDTFTARRIALAKIVTLNGVATTYEEKRVFVDSPLAVDGTSVEFSATKVLQLNQSLKSSYDGAVSSSHASHSDDQNASQVNTNASGVTVQDFINKVDSFVVIDENLSTITLQGDLYPDSILIRSIGKVGTEFKQAFFYNNQNGYHYVDIATVNGALWARDGSGNSFSAINGGASAVTITGSGTTVSFGSSDAINTNDSVTLAGLVSTGFIKNVDGRLQFAERLTPGSGETPDINTMQIYFKSDEKLYKINPLGTEVQIASLSDITKANVGLSNVTDDAQVKASQLIRNTFINSDLAAGVLTIIHNLALSAPYTVIVTIFDNAGKQIIPDEVTGSTNSVAIDLTSFGALTGTWGYLLLG